MQLINHVICQVYVKYKEGRCRPGPRGGYFPKKIIFLPPPPFSKMIFIPTSTVKISPFPPVFHHFPFIFTFFLHELFLPQPTNNSYDTPLPDLIRNICSHSKGKYNYVILIDFFADKMSTNKFINKFARLLITTRCMSSSQSCLSLWMFSEIFRFFI